MTRHLDLHTTAADPRALAAFNASTAKARDRYHHDQALVGQHVCDACGGEYRHAWSLAAHDCLGVTE